MIHVPGIGPSNAKLAVIGEAPGGQEELTKIPFSGPSGRMVDDCLEFSGVSRSEVYLSNVVKIRPPNNDITKLSSLGYTIQDFIPQLEEEIRLLQPNCIVAVGNTALEALTGFRGIEKYRGSILKSHLGPKVVGSIHPASILHAEAEHGGKMKSWVDLHYIKWDFARAVKQSQFKEYEPPRRNLIVCRSSMDLYRFLDRNGDKDLVAVDIETFHTIPICISFAFSRYESISVPLFNNLGSTGITRTDLITCWKEIADLMANPRIRKIGQNFKFDERQIDTCYDGTCFFGLKTNGFYFDTMLAFRILYPELPAKLEFISSVLTEEPYYKEEGKGFNPRKDKIDRLLLYNAKDSAVTFECFEVELEELRERDQLEFFFTRVMPLHPFYSRVESRGILRDNFQQKFLKEKYQDLLKDLQIELNGLTQPLIGDRQINANSNGKNGDVPWLVYSVLNLPLRGSTDEQTLDALLRNHAKANPAKRILELILKIRKVRKTIGTYIEAEVDHRNRLLTSYRIILETGRTSTGILKPPVTTKAMGLAFQTITKHGDTGTDLRSMFVPDPGYIFIEPDQSGAEARVVAILAKDEKLLKMFQYNVDVHRVTRSWILNNSPDNLLESFFASKDDLECISLAKQINSYLKALIDDEDRQIGKMFRHAGHLGMKKRVASEQAHVSEWRAGQILDKFHATNPNIRGVFHKGIQDALLNNDRVLINPFGRRRQFLYKWGDELFKEAYSEIPQSTVSDQTKFAAIRIERRLPFIQILQESHDSFLAQLPISELDYSVPIIQEEMERPIDFKDCTLSRGILHIPCEIKIGKTNWETMERII